MNLKQMKVKSSKKTGDWLILFLTVLIAGYGVVMVYSASYYAAEVQYGDKFYFAKKQFVGFLIGLTLMLIVSRFDYKKLKKKKIRLACLIIPVILLGLVFVPGLGKTNYGATRWIGVGGVTIQPSELAKYGFVVFSAGYMSENMEKMRKFGGMLPVLGAGGLICVLIILEPNMSVTMCVGALILGMLFAGGVRWKHFAVILVPALIAIPVLIIVEPYRLLRLSAFLDPWASPKEEGYQLIQSLYALGNGGWFGTGLFQSRQKYRFLPFAESDFILAIIGEETGFIGITVFFLTAGLLVYRGLRAATKSEDFFSFLLAFGITLVFGIQICINALVVSGAIPPTGIPLPLVSSGNTALIITMVSMGVLYATTKAQK